MNPYPKPQKQEKKKPAKIKPRSQKRAKEYAEYRPIRNEFLLDNPICQFKGCNKESVDNHHKRGKIGRRLLDKRWFLAVCREHHDYLERNPNYAKANGYSSGRLSNI